MTDQPVGRVITPPCRLAFPFLREPRPKFEEGDRLTYQATVLIPPDVDLAPFAAAIKAVMMDKWKKIVPMKPHHIPIRDCAEKSGNAGYEEGWHYINTHSGYQPSAVLADATPTNDWGLFYPGCWCIFALDAYAWGGPSSKFGQGVSFGVTALQFYEDDERFDNKVDASELFSAIEVEGAPPKPSNPLSDLIG